MAKNDNLTDFLTDVANAIREKKGTTDLINPQDFSAEIASIETGGGEGGGGGAAAGAVNFRDYDGTILHSFSKDELLALTKLPELPTQAGLICQGWNWSLEDAQSYVAEYGILEVGATYITDDGATRLYITTPKKTFSKVFLYFYQSVANGVLIDWGDGTVTSSNTKGNASAAHTYEAEGSFVISLKPQVGCTMYLGRNSSSYSVLGPSGSSGYAAINAMLHKVEIGENITQIGNYAFKDCVSLKYVTIPNNIVATSTNSFYYCRNLAALVFPSSINSISTYCAFGCSNLESVSLPNGLTSIGAKAFSEAQISILTIPNSVISIGSNSFYAVDLPERLIIPKSIKTIDISAFGSSKCLKKLEVYFSQLTTSNSIFKNGAKLQDVVFRNMEAEAEVVMDASIFEECRALQSCTLPKSTALKSSFFKNCMALTTIDIPEGVTEIGSSCFSACYALSIVTLPSTLATISSNAFEYAAGLGFMDCRKCTSVPTLASAFPTLQSWMKIIVPDTLYDSWVAATNWSAVAKYIVKASEYTD